MARTIVSKPNTDPAGTYSGKSYPYGKIKDDTGIGDGTPINTQVYGDMHQFFAKLMADGGLAFNGLAENATDGFQFNRALGTLICPFFGNTGVVFETGGANDWDNAGSPYGKFHYQLSGDVNNGIVTLAGVMKNNSFSSPGTPKIMTLPAAIRPSYRTPITVMEDLGGGGTLAPIQLYINTDGTITPESSSLTGQTLIYFDGVSYRLGLDAY